MAGALVALALSCAAPTSNRHASSDLFAVELVSEEDGTLRAGRIRNLTRRQGYDNQPHFLPDGLNLLYSSRLPDHQLDIFHFDLQVVGRRRLTETPDSEYSPVPLPRGGGFSVVRLELDGAQRLWQFDESGAAPVLLLERDGLIGYYAWIDEGTLALSILGQQDDDPNRLEVVDLGTGEGRFIELEGSLGRCLQPVPGRRAVSFVDEISDSEWWIKELDLDTQEVRRLAPTVAQSEDFAWTPSGSLIMGQGSRLYEWREDTSEAGTPGQWREFGDVSSFGVSRVTRLAVNPEGNLLIIVARQRGRGRD